MHPAIKKVLCEQAGKDRVWLASGWASDPHMEMIVVAHELVRAKVEQRAVLIGPHPDVPRTGQDWLLAILRFPPVENCPQ